MSERTPFPNDEILVDGAVGASPSEALARDAVLVDVRRRAARRESGQGLAGAPYRDPEAFDAADPLWRGDAEVLVFCVHGHEVSQGVCAKLRAAGIPARYVVGGLDGLTAAGAALTDLPSDEGEK